MSLIKISFSRLTAMASIALVLLFGLALAVNYFGMFRAFDVSVLRFLFAAHNPALTKIFLAFTFLGDALFVLPLTAFLAIFFFYKKQLPYFFLFVGTMVGASVSLFLLKHVVHRIRPDMFPWLVPESGFSFPSGHATLSIAFYGLLAYLWASSADSGASTKRTKSSQWNIFFIWLFLVFGIGLSRLYLGVHYPTDIIAGYLTGFIFLCVGIEIFEQYAHTRKNNLS